MKRAYVLLLGILLLGGCSTFRRNPNTAGQITDTGALGATLIQGVGNAGEAAQLDRKEHGVVIDHKSGDELKISAKGSSEILGGILESIRDDNEEATKRKVQATALPNEWEITYLPKDGARTTVSGIEVKASTGHSREDTAAITAEILNSTKAIMYVGLALILGGGAIAWAMRVPMQGSMIAGVGVGLIVLQSTLANPMWSWIVLILLLGIPLFWLWHLWRNKKVSDTMVKSIEEFKEKHPDKRVDLEHFLSKNMVPSEKRMIIRKKREVFKK